MKKIINILIVITLSAMFFISCGGDKSSKSTSEKNAVNDTAGKTFNTQYLNINLNSDWSVSDYGAHNDKGYSIFSFKVNSSGNIYNDFNKDHEQVGEVTETTVDGMPAITRRQKFMQNEMKMSRVWLIYDGVNVISFNVAAPEKDYNDKVAEKLVSKVKIAHKEKDVKLPVKAGDANSDIIKPAVFPEETINNFKDILSADAVLSEEKINNAIKTIDDLQKMEDEKTQDMEDAAKNKAADKVAKSNGFADFDDMMNKTLKPALTSATILTMVEKDKMGAMTPFIKDMVSQQNISFADLKFTYDHWDLVMGLYNRVRAKK